jgi:hypothetical protein
MQNYTDANRVVSNVLEMIGGVMKFDDLRISWLRPRPQILPAPPKRSVETPRHRVVGLINWRMS